MDRRMRHRALIYVRLARGELVEAAVRQAPSPSAVLAIAEAEGRRRRRGAVAYTTELDANGEEAGTPLVLGRWGDVPDAGA